MTRQPATGELAADLVAVARQIEGIIDHWDPAQPYLAARVSAAADQLAAVYRRHFACPTR